MLLPVLVTAPTELPVSLVEAKAWCDIDYSEHDTLITAMLEAAVAHLDGYNGVLGFAIMEQTWKQSYSAFQSRLRLPVGGVTSVSSVKHYDDDNVEQATSTGLYGRYEDHLSAYVELLRNASWPSVYERADAVTIEYVCGVDDAALVHPSIKTAIKMLVADQYENREAQTEYNLTENKTVYALLAPVRRAIL